MRVLLSLAAITFVVTADTAVTTNNWPPVQKAPVIGVGGVIESVTEESMATGKPNNNFKFAKSVKVLIDGEVKSTKDLKPGMTGSFFHQKKEWVTVLIGDNKKLKKTQDGPVCMSPRHFKTGMVGYLKLDDRSEINFKFNVIRVVDEKSVVLLLPGDPNLPFLARTPTADMVDGQKVDLPGLWRVVGTTKVGTRTMYAIEPVPEKKGKK